MKPTIIIKCTNCGGFIMASKDQKTKTCPYCGVHVTVNKAIKVASAKDPFEASNKLKKLKSQEGFPDKRN